MEEGVETAVEHILHGVSLEIVGRPGSGRTRFLDALATQLEVHGGSTVMMHGVGAMSGRALTSIMASLPDVGRHPTIGECVVFLERKVGSTGILLVDDADDLDDVSAGVLAALRTRTSAPFVVVRRMGSRSAPLRQLLASLQPSMRHEVRPMAFGRLRSMVEADLGRSVDEQTMARIATLSGRLPGLARAIALGGDQVARLARARDWRREEEPAWPSALGQNLEALLIDAAQEDVEALTMLAVGGQLSVRDACALVPADRIERLNGLGLLDFIDGPNGGTVGLYPPVMSEYLRSECTATTRVAIRETSRSKGVDLPGDGVQERSAATPVNSAILSRSMAAHWSATARERLARWQAEPSPATAIDLMTAVLAADESVVAPGVVYEATVQAAARWDDSMVDLAAWYAVYLALGEADRVAADRVLDDAGHRYPQGRERLAAISSYLELLLERVPALEDRRRVAAESGAGPGELHAVDIAVDVTRGDTASALARLAERPICGEMFRHHGGVFRSLALTLDGATADGLALARRGFVTAQRDWDPVALQAYGFALALAAAIRGAFEELDDVFSRVMTMTSLSPLQVQYRGGVAGLAAARARWLDLPGPRDADPAQVAAGDARFGPLPFYGAGLVVAPNVTSQPDVDTVWHAAEEAARRGYVVAAAFAAVEAAEREPDTGRYARIEPVLATAPSPFVRAMSDLADAMVRRDHAGLAKLSESFAEQGAWLYAARAGIQSALVLREEGEHPAAARRARECWERVTPAAEGTTRLFAKLAGAADLSPREQQIAELIGQGRATHDVAHALVLSARTVEHHLLNIYRKAGVDSRDGLRLAFATWLRPAGPHRTVA